MVLFSVSSPKFILCTSLRIIFQKQWSEYITPLFINLPIIQEIECKLHFVISCLWDGLQLTFTPSSSTIICVKPALSGRLSLTSESVAHSLPSLYSSCFFHLQGLLLLLPLHSHSFFKASNISSPRPTLSLLVRINFPLLLFHHSTLFSSK